MLALLLVALLLSNAIFTIEYTGEDLILTARILFLKIQIFPDRDPWWHRKSMSRRRARKIKEDLDAEAARKREKKAKKAAKKAAKKEEAKNKKGKLRSPTEILDILNLAISLVKQLRHRFLKHLKIKFTRVKITIAAEDAAVTAVTYGAVTQSINILFPLLEDIKNFKLPSGDNLEILTDFTSDESLIDLKLSFSIRVFRVLGFAFGSFIELIKYFFTSQEHKEKRSTRRSAQAVMQKKGNPKNKKS